MTTLGHAERLAQLGDAPRDSTGSVDTAALALLALWDARENAVENARHRKRTWTKAALIVGTICTGLVVYEREVITFEKLGAGVNWLANRTTAEEAQRQQIAQIAKQIVDLKAAIKLSKALKHRNKCAARAHVAVTVNARRLDRKERFRAMLLRAMLPDPFDAERFPTFLRAELKHFWRAAMSLPAREEIFAETTKPDPDRNVST